VDSWHSLLSKKENADKAGHKEAPDQNHVRDVGAASVPTINGKGGKHADEYAKLLDSVHGCPVSAILCLSSQRRAVLA